MTKNKVTLEEVLDDLLSRFILNCPEEEHDSFERLFFQIEEAHWFYDDFYRENNKHLPNLSLKQFAKFIFQQCPLLKPYEQQVAEHLENFYLYKRGVKVCGAILLNSSMDKVLLVRSYYAKSWGFPRGKINKNEEEIDCAVREVKEETGYDVSHQLIDKDFIEMKFGDQTVKLFIISGVSEDVEFKPETKKEISQVQWHLIDEILSPRRSRPPSPTTLSSSASTAELLNAFLHNSTSSFTQETDLKKKKPTSSKFWSVVPFIGKLKRWIHIKRTQSSPNSVFNNYKNSNSNSVRGAKKKLSYSDTYNNNNNKNFGINTQNSKQKRSNTFHPSMKTGNDIRIIKRPIPISHSYHSNRAKSLLNFSFNTTDILPTQKVSV